MRVSDRGGYDGGLYPAILKEMHGEKSFLLPLAESWTNIVTDEINTSFSDVFLSDMFQVRMSETRKSFSSHEFQRAVTNGLTIESS